MNHAWHPFTRAPHVGREAHERFVSVTIKNFGPTPALEVVSVYGEAIREWPLRARLPDPPESVRRSVEPLPPGRQSIQQLPIDELTELEESELKAGRFGIYFWGNVTYADIFGDRHETRIRLVFKLHPNRRGHGAQGYHRLRAGCFAAGRRSNFSS